MLILLLWDKYTGYSSFHNELHCIFNGKNYFYQCIENYIPKLVQRLTFQKEIN